MHYLLPQILLFIILLSPFAAADWRPGEMLVKLEVPDAAALARLNNLDLTIDHTRLPLVYLHVTPSELTQLRTLGFNPAILIQDMTRYSQDLLQQPGLAGYREHQSLIAFAAALQQNWPDLVKIVEYGTSINHRKLIAIKISDNASIDEMEPEVAFDAGIHGDEIVTSELLTRFMEELCQGYGQDPRITQLVKSREIWFFPMINPDGRESLNRRNGNYVDLNRDWGFMWNARGNSSLPYSQPETRAALQWILDHHFVIQQTLHAGSRLISYPWSCTSEAVPDAPLFNFLAGGYAATTTYEQLPHGSGYKHLYPIHGNAKDSYYALRGTLAWTLEIHQEKAPAFADVEKLYQKNREAFYYLLQSAGKGIAGRICDAVTGKPVKALVTVRDERRCYWPVYNSPLQGDFQKYLLQGLYTLTIQANGYRTAVIPDIAVADSGAAFLSIELTPEAGSRAFQILATRYPARQNSGRNYAFHALGEADRQSYALGRNGWIVLDMGQVIRDLPGNDLRIYEGDGTAEGFVLEAAEHWQGPWSTIGSGKGTSEFDLANSRTRQLRYLRIIDDGDGFSGLSDAGFDLDAVEGQLIPVNRPYLIAEQYVVIDTLNNFNGLLETGELAGLRLKISNLGTSPSSPAILRVHNNTSGAELIRDQTSVGELLPGASAWCDGVQLAVKSSELGGGVIDLQLDISSADGQFWQHPLMLPVYGGARLALDQQQIDFGESWLNTTTRQVLALQNTGMDTLKIFRLQNKLPVFEVSATQLLIAPGKRLLLPLLFLPQDTSTYRDTLSILCNDPQTPRIIIPLCGQGLRTPELQLTTDSLQLTLLPNDSVDVILHLANSGSGRLSYTAHCELPLSGEQKPGFGYELPEPGDPAAPVFRWSAPSPDSRVFSAADLTTPSQQPLSLKDPLPFLGQMYRQMRISNGGMLFLRPAAEKNASSAEEVVLAPLAGPFQARDDSRIYLFESGQFVMVRWQALYLADGSGPFSFQATLYRNGDIHFLYRDVPATATHLRSGYQAGSGTWVNLLPDNVRPVNDSIYSLLARGRCAIHPESGNLPAGESQSLRLRISSRNYPGGSYYLRLVVQSNDPNLPWRTVPLNIRIRETMLSKLEDGSAPQEIELLPNYPNPFNPQTTIRFRLPEQLPARLTVYNTLGQVINTLIDEPLPAGEYRIPWKAINEFGQMLPSGIYFYELRVGTVAEIRKMILLH